MILVTGASGFLGAHLIDELLEKGEEVRGADIVPPHRKDYEFVEADVRNYKSIRKAMRGADVVYHLAALSSHRLSLRPYHAYTDTNVIGTRNVLEASIKEEVRKVLLSSSSTVYGKPRPEDLPLREDQPPRPMGPYAISKVATENYCLYYMSCYGLPVTIVRYFNAIGPRCRPNVCLSIFARKVLKGEPPIVFGLQLTRDFTDVRDSIDATILAMECEEANGEIVNIGAGREIKVLDLAWMIIKTLGKEGELEPLVDESKLSPHEAIRHFSDNRKARRLLGWTPRFSIEETVRDYIEWLRERQETSE